MCAAEGFDLLIIEKRGRHVALRFSAGMDIAPCTPSDHRNRLNLRATIRRMHH